MEKELGVILAKTAGFCPGVKKAIDKVLELAQQGKGPIYTLGPLIHNTQVIQTLEQKNIRAVKDTGEVSGKNGVLVIRAHGITPELEKEIRSLSIEIIDGTCPLVKNAQNIIKKYADAGFETVIVGDSGHAEVTGLLGYSGGKGHVVAGPEEAGRLPAFEKVNVVAQTTQEEEIFLKTAEIVRKKSKECVVSDTICAPTRQRQAETAALAESSELMIVVGGKHSANTARLAQLCREHGVETVHIENEDELPPQKLLRPSRIGVTAGASTPGWMTERVISKIKQIRSAGRSSKLNPLLSIWGFTVNSCVYAASAAMSLTYVCMKLQGCGVDWHLLLLSGLFVMSLHIINRLAEKGTGAAGGGRIPPGHKTALSIAGISAGVLAILISATCGIKVFAVVIFFWMLGVLYPFRVMLGLKSLMDFPASKDTATALGWGFVCAYVPGLYQGIILTKAHYLALVFAILLVFMRSVMLGISSVQNDLIVGKENFYKALGPRTTYLTIFSMLVMLAAVLMLLLEMDWKISLVKALLAGLCYSTACFILYYFNRFPKGIWAETLVDTQFLIFGLLTFAGFKS